MCGVVGVFNSEAAAFDTMLGLFAIQNRGQESCGLAVSNGNQIKLMRGLGLVKEDILLGVPVILIILSHMLLKHSKVPSLP
jgi:glutamine phosphoribosylpyrophosphate amidotransferase